jgi:hypothetical protein
MRKILTALLITVASPTVAQQPNIIVEAMIRSGLAQSEAQARYELDLEARSLQERLQRDEPSFAGMYGDARRGNSGQGVTRIFVRFTGDAKRTLHRSEFYPVQ